MSNDFIDKIDNLFRKETDPDRLLQYHNARAQICLYDEIYRLRLATLDIVTNLSPSAKKTARVLDVRGEEINTALVNATNVINQASKESTCLSSKIVGLTRTLAIATIVLGLLAGAELAIKIYDRFFFEPEPVVTEQTRQFKTVPAPQETKASAN